MKRMTTQIRIMDQHLINLEKLWMKTQTNMNPMALFLLQKMSNEMRYLIKILRKYQEFIKYGIANEEERPLCVNCSDKLANESFKPAKLKSHLETKQRICK